MLDVTITDVVEWLQPYAVLVSAIFSVAALGFLVNILRLSREAAADRIKVFEDRLAGAKEERERDEKWYTREKERLERELAESRTQIEKLLAGAGLDLSALALGEGLRTLTDDLKRQVNVLTEELEKRLSALPPSLDDARAKAQLSIAKGNMAVGKWGRAAAQLDEYSIHEAPDWEAQFSRGVAHANARRGPASDIAALRAYNDAIALAPPDMERDYRARLHAYRGAILKRLRRLDEAAADLTIARQLATATYEVVDIQYNFACVFAMRGDRPAMLQAVRQLAGAPNYLAAIRAHLHDYFDQYRDDPELLALIKANS